MVGPFLARERWGTCDGTIGHYGAASFEVSKCGKPAAYVAVKPDGDGNHLRYCVDCAKAA